MQVAPDPVPRPAGRRSGFPLRTVRRHGVPVLAELPVEGDTRRGVLLPMRPAPLTRAVLFAVLAAAFAGLSVAAVGLALGGRPRVALGALVFVPFGLLCGAAAYVALRSRRLSSVGLGLTPTHVVLANLVRPVAVRWDQIRRIGPPSIRWGTGPLPDPGTNLVAIVVTDETLLAHLPAAARRVGVRALRRTGEVTLATVPETAWAMDPTVAYSALRCYLDRPDLRAELAGEAALRRIERRALAARPVDPSG